MEEETSLEEKVLSFIRSNLLFLTLFSAGVTFLGIGLIQMFGSKSAEIKFEKAQGIETAGTSKIKVDVDGQVFRPGVYTLGPDARVQDALIAAGGLAPDADRSAINLAAKIADGQKIYIPARGEAVPASINSAVTQVSDTASAGLVPINSATESELDTLPGVGPVTARKIIEGRPYGSLEDLLDRKIVGNATFEKISGLVSL